MSYADKAFRNRAGLIHKAGKAILRGFNENREFLYKMRNYSNRAK